MKKTKFIMMIALALSVSMLLGCGSDQEAQIDEIDININIDESYVAESVGYIAEDAQNTEVPPAVIDFLANNPFDENYIADEYYIAQVVNVMDFVTLDDNGYVVLVTEDSTPVFADEQYVASVIVILENFNEFYGKNVRLEGVLLTTGDETGDAPVFRMVMRQDFSC